MKPKRRRVRGCDSAMRRRRNASLAVRENWRRRRKVRFAVWLGEARWSSLDGTAQLVDGTALTIESDLWDPSSSLPADLLDVGTHIQPPRSASSPKFIIKQVCLIYEHQLRIIKQGNVTTTRSPWECKNLISFKCTHTSRPLALKKKAIT